MAIKFIRSNGYQGVKASDDAIIINSAFDGQSGVVSDYKTTEGTALYFRSTYDNTSKKIIVGGGCAIVDGRQVIIDNDGQTQLDFDAPAIVGTTSGTPKWVFLVLIINTTDSTLETATLEVRYCNFGEQASIVNNLKTQNVMVSTGIHEIVIADGPCGRNTNGTYTLSYVGGNVNNLASNFATNCKRAKSAANADDSALIDGATLKVANGHVTIQKNGATTGNAPIGLVYSLYNCAVTGTTTNGAAKIINYIAADDQVASFRGYNDAYNSLDIKGLNEAAIVGGGEIYFILEYKIRLTPNNDAIQADVPIRAKELTRNITFTPDKSESGVFTFEDTFDTTMISNTVSYSLPDTNGGYKTYHKRSILKSSITIPIKFDNIKILTDQMIKGARADNTTFNYSTQSGQNNPKECLFASQYSDMYQTATRMLTLEIALLNFKVVVG